MAGKLALRYKCKNTALLNEIEQHIAQRHKMYLHKYGTAKFKAIPNYVIKKLLSACFCNSKKYFNTLELELMTYSSLKTDKSCLI